MADAAQIVREHRNEWARKRKSLREHNLHGDMKPPVADRPESRGRNG